ncbi:MAG TPA: hypothetical protein GX404_05440 [Syntrophomonadaceae bacterium]|nr:hypothetical protein [Syntrophomonadaceae bacterium]
MQLLPGEKAILAYFSSPVDAQTACDKLQQLGIHHARAEAIQGDTRQPRSTTSLASMTGETRNPNLYHAYGPLLAASPDSSGLSSDGEQDYYTHMVSLICPPDKHTQVIEIIRQHNGLV